jgi:hypothetical protein
MALPTNAPGKKSTSAFQVGKSIHRVMAARSTSKLEGFKCLKDPDLEFQFVTQ